MANRRILSVWFPRLGADRLLRRLGDLHGAPFAVLEEIGQMQIISALCPLAEAAGLRVGQPARDAHAMCAGLITRLRYPHAEAAFLNVLTRWAGRYTPWVAAQPPDALMLDITGCAHLFGGETALMAQLIEEAGDMGVAAECGLADTPGAAWALARYAGRGAAHVRSGDAIDQEARATRSRAAKRRHWERGGAAPATATHTGTHTGTHGAAPRIAAPGQTRQALAGLPVAALRLDGDTTTALARLGLRRIGDLTGQPRGPLARRFGKGLLLRMDQALGAVPEPVSPHAAPPRYATRLSLPEPIGLREDVVAALDRLIPRLCQMLRDKGRGARAIRLEIYRCDDTMDWAQIGLARPADQPERIAPLLAMKLDDLDAGYGIDVLRLEATQTEPLHSARPAGHLDAANAARDHAGRNTAMEDLIGRIGARTGLDRITRRHPASSHIPEKCATIQPAAWSEPAPPGSWPAPPSDRPLLIWRPELVTAPEVPRPPAQFRWRGTLHDLADARGPERIAPEWWLDEPEWRSGVRDYWDVVTTGGARLWLFYAHGAALSPGWFCQGQFA